MIANMAQVLEEENKDVSRAMHVIISTYVNVSYMPTYIQCDFTHACSNHLVHILLS